MTELVHLNSGSDFPNICGAPRHPRDTVYWAEVTCPECNRIRKYETDKAEFIAELIENPDFWYNVLESDFLADNGLPDFPVDSKKSEFPVSSDFVRNSGEIELPVTLPPPRMVPEKPQVAAVVNTSEPVGPTIHEIINGLSTSLTRVGSLLHPNTPVVEIHQAMSIAHMWVDTLTMKVLKNEL